MEYWAKVHFMHFPHASSLQVQKFLFFCYSLKSVKLIYKILKPGYLLTICFAHICTIEFFPFVTILSLRVTSLKLWGFIKYFCQYFHWSGFNPYKPWHVFSNRQSKFDMLINEKKNPVDICVELFYSNQGVVKEICFYHSKCHLPFSVVIFIFLDTA